MTQYIQDLLGHSFKDPQLLKRALTHKSAGNPGNDYERLEFLGDRILGFIVAEWVYEQYPNENEGELSRRFMGLVCQETLSEIARSLEVQSHIKFSKSEEACGGRENDAVLCDVMESLIAALYLETNIETVRKFIKKYWQYVFNQRKSPPIDPKTELQEITQKKYKKLPIYTLLKTEGSAHAPVFTMEVFIDGHPACIGSGPSKSKAEKAAAIQLLEEIR